TQHFGAHGYVRVSLRVAAFRSGSDRSISAEFYLALEQAGDAAIVHHQNDEISRLSANLETYASAFQCVHRRRAPWPPVISASAANHHSAAVASAHHESRLHHRRQDHHTAGLIEQILRNVVRHV